MASPPPVVGKGGRGKVKRIWSLEQKIFTPLYIKPLVMKSKLLDPDIKQIPGISVFFFLHFLYFKAFYKKKP